MRRRMLSIFAALMTLPAFAQAPADGLLIWAHDLELALGEFADWSQGQSFPEDIGGMNRVRLCEKRSSQAASPACHYMYWARGHEREPGHVARVGQFQDGESVKELKWYRVNPKWNRRLMNRLMVWRPMDYAAGDSPPYYGPGYCTTPDGNPQAMPYMCN